VTPDGTRQRFAGTGFGAAGPAVAFARWVERLAVGVAVRVAVAFGFGLGLGVLVVVLDDDGAELVTGDVVGVPEVLVVEGVGAGAAWSAPPHAASSSEAAPATAASRAAYRGCVEFMGAGVSGRFRGRVIRRQRASKCW
jgi:hypothetical protein